MLHETNEKHDFRLDARWKARTGGTFLSMLIPLFLALRPAPASAEIVTLAALEKLALENRDLRAGAAMARSAEAEVAKARGGYHPQLGFRADVSTITGSHLVEVRDTNGATYLVSGARGLDQPNAWLPKLRETFDLSVSQRIYDFGRTRSAVQAAKSNAASVDIDNRLASADQLHAVRVAYLKWLAAHELSRAAAHAAGDAEAQRLRVENLIGSGVRPKSDLTPAQGEELLAKLEYARAAEDINTARATLEDAAGVRLPETAEPDPMLLLEGAVKPENASDLEQRSLEHQRAAALARALAFRRGRYPELGLGTSLGLRAQEGNVVPLYTLGLTLTVPIWDGGVSKANATAAEAEADSVELRMHSHGDRLARERDRAKQDAQAARLRLKLAQQLVAVGEARLESAREGYELGARPVEALFAARAMLRKAHGEVVLAKVALAEATLKLPATPGTANQGTEKPQDLPQPEPVFRSVHSSQR
jgi:outer membrane protein